MNRIFIDRSPRLKLKKMESDRGAVRPFRKFRTDLLVEVVLLLAMVGYFVGTASQSVGENISVTAIGAGLMALLSWWTLTTVSDGLELLVSRDRTCH
ncbi:hypothetical protein [Marinobacter mobilis]|uniref:Uncharacterized protein n=2 Tax=Marinobacter mobilis TaxID=488533 RepID=A0A1H2W2D6_9GAMM|nr:hypothetical protein SAMN04487960_10435 [Marinobacter mobilis]SDX52164.1 hypothetical protein SAMN04487960_110134 [Marinobacter mobilis]